ncbi:MAG TPA: EAL domain-containing protein [Acidimicrobiales bacterium]|nr:EAL domain-containing protein [Acidimicrobiales bacterium]
MAIDRGEPNRFTVTAELLQSIAEIAADPMTLYRVEGPDAFRHEWVDRRATKGTGLSPVELEGKLISEVVPPAVAERFHANANLAIAQHSPVRYTATSGWPAGVVTLEITMSPIFIDDHCEHLIVNVRDVTDHVAAEAERNASLERLRRVMENAADLVWLVGVDGRIQYVTPAIERVLGYTPESLLGGDPFALLVPEDIPMMGEFFTKVVEHPDLPHRTEIRTLHRDGSQHWVDMIVTNLIHDPNVGAIVVNARDVTDRKHAEDRLKYQAHHDALTGLPNRTLLEHQLTERLRDSAHPERLAALIFVDYDGFKLVNDSLGHQRGDELIRETAVRLRDVVGDRAWLARLGGDEFVIVSTQLEDVDSHLKLAQQIKTALGLPFLIADRQLYMTVSVGVATGAGTLESTADTMMRNADMAMYSAKRQRLRTPKLFDESLSTDSKQRLETMTLLRRAITEQQFVLYYQPVVSIPSRNVVGAEALIRWNHPTKGLVPPAEFILLAEESELIVPIGEWVIEQACQQLRKWVDAGLGRMEVAVNVSPKQLADERFQQRLETAISRSGIDPSLLVLEITENLIMEDPEAARSLLQRVGALGVKCAIDDFGTGYSSLAYLPRFPAQTIKIDRSFVQGIAGAPSDHDQLLSVQQQQTLVGAIIAMAHALDRSVVAEGVETVDQMRTLVQLGCERAQGFLFARPMPADQLADFVRAQRRAAQLALADRS